MPESLFTSIMEEWVDSKWESCADAPEFTTSKKHDRAMKRIFRRYERNAQRLTPSVQKLRKTTKRLLIVLVMILLAMIAGCYMAHTLYVEPDSESGITKVSFVPVGGSPRYIKNEYYLPELPDGFEKKDKVYVLAGSHLDTTLKIDTIYENKQTGRGFNLRQEIRSSEPAFYDTRKHELLEVDINGHSGVFMDKSDGDHIEAYVLWDVGDYILQISGDLPKNDILNLAKSAELSEKKIVSN